MKSVMKFFDRHLNTIVFLLPIATMLVGFVSLAKGHQWGIGLIVLGLAFVKSRTRN
jgi:hypothetical protein